MPLEYEIYIQPKGVDYSIGEECLFQDRGQPNPFIHLNASRGNIQYFDSVQEKRLVRPTWDINPTESALSQVPRMFAEPEQFRKDLASSTHYHVLDVGHKAPVRLPQAMRTATLPGKDGEDPGVLSLHDSRDRYQRQNRKCNERQEESDHGSNPDETA